VLEADIAQNGALTRSPARPIRHSYSGTWLARAGLNYKFSYF